MKKWAVAWIYQDENRIEFFPDAKSSGDKVTELIKQAEQEAYDNEGRYPSWIYDTCVLEVRGWVQDHPDGLRVR